MNRVENFLVNRFPNNPSLTDCLIDLHHRYADWGLKDTKFDQDFTDGEDEHFYSYLWEMLLASHFKNIGLDISSADEGPDFKIDLSGQTIWVEAICPAPTGLPDDWLRATQAGEIRVRSVPHEEMLLRWTAALKEKKEKLTGKRERDRITGTEVVRPGYAAKGTVGQDDPYVIAVGACRLGQLETDLHLGISQLPYAVEAVFPVGPLEVVISRETMETVDTRHGHRLFIRKPSGAEVPTDSFLNPDYAGVSAILGSPAGLNAACGSKTPIAVVHNPLAISRLPVGIFGADEEYVAEDKGDHYELKDLNKAID
jgi:type I restriction enzyme S subunit